MRRSEMKKRVDRYRLVKRVQQLIMAMLVVEGVGVVGKGIYMAKKISLVQAGLEQYSQEAWLESEETLQKAKAYSYFKYHENGVIQALEELDWITNYHEALEEVYQLLKRSEDNLDYELFKNTLETYENLKLEELEDYQKNYYASKFPIQKAIEEEWIQFKGYMQTLLMRPVEKEQYNWAKMHIGEVPASYFSEDKTETLRSLFEKCDEQLFTKITVGEGTFEDKLAAYNEIYEFNKQCGYSTSWLNAKIQAYVKEEITKNMVNANEEGLRQVRNNPKTALRNPNDSDVEAVIQNFFYQTKAQIEAYVQIIQDYKANANLAYYDLEIERMIDEYIQQKENEIQILIEAKYYDEAISWYEDLKPIRDFTAEIEQLQKIKYYEDPVLIIENNLSAYSFYEVGVHAFNVEKYLVAINRVTSNLELYKIIKEADGYTYVKLDISLANLGFEQADLESALDSDSDALSVIAYEDLLGVHTKRSQEEQSEKLAVFKVRENQIESIFSKVGESISVNSNLRNITVIGQEDEESSSYDAYTYNGETYDKQVQVVEDIDIGYLTAEYYMNQTISFVCYIPESNAEQAVMGYAYAGNVYYSDKGVSLQLEEERVLQAGYYKVTGKVVGETNYFVENLNQDMNCPEIRVSSIETIGTN